MSALLLVLLGLPLAGAVLLWLLPVVLGDRIAALVGSVVSRPGPDRHRRPGYRWLSPGPATGPERGLVEGSPGRYVGPGPAAAMLGETDVSWMPALDVRFHVGVDSISMPLIVLTALLVFLCCVYSLRITPQVGRMRSLIALLLVIETGVIGTFCALDLVLFFIFFEVVLIPMWLVIDIWGDHHDRGRTAARGEPVRADDGARLGRSC